jgi:pyruvate,water dikinase
VPAGFVVAAGAAAAGRGAIASQVKAQLRSLGEGLFAVRSSAVGEDGALHSFAGQLETMLSVEADGVLDAIEKCWASTGALRALSYGGELGDVAVLVQRMVPADAAGVAFSADPLSGERGVAVIETVPSLADRLVSGAVDPEAWRVHGSGCQRVRELDQPVISEAQARRVAELAEAMEQLFGAPQDVEWALHDDQIHLLQSRPITALPAEPVPIPVEVPDGGWDRDDHHGVLSPLGWDWIRPYPDELCQAFRSSGAPIEAMRPARIGGHLYMQMAMEGGESQKLPPRWVLWLASRLAPPLRRANRMAEAFLDEERFMDALDEYDNGGRAGFRAEIDDIFVAEPRALSDDELLERIRRALGLTEKGLRKHAWLHGPQFFSLGKLVLFVRDELGWSTERIMAIPSGLSGATTELHRHLEAIVRKHRDEIESIDTLPRSWSTLSSLCPQLAGELAAWLADNRLRMLHYEPKYPTLGERPAFVLSVVDGIVQNLRAGDGGRDESDPFAEALAEAQAKLEPAKLAEFERLLKLVERGYGVRDENGIELVSRPTGLLRYFVLELGRRIESVIGRREHAVYLYADEHAAALRGEIDDLAERIERRRGEESWALRNPGPLRYGPPKPSPPPADVFPRGMARLLRIMEWMDEVHGTPEPSDDEVMRGVGIGSRVITGRARVVHHPEQMAGLRHGEIVVCRITSPECAVALGRVAAIVTNEGGMLSHPAIIAREFDVPAVVGAAQATERLRTGDTIRVDPLEGTVSLIG